MKVGRVTLSDRAHAGVYEDLSGPAIEASFLREWGEPCEFERRLLPDDMPAISAALVELCDVCSCALIITTGGTGPSRRDVTPEATRAVIHCELPGFGEIQRSISFATVPTAILSRATAGVYRNALIVNLPGNPKAIDVCLPPLIPAIREALKHLQA